MPIQIQPPNISNLGTCYCYQYFFNIFASHKYGLVAEWLGRGLQNLVQRFDSARDLEKEDKPFGLSSFILIILKSVSFFNKLLL